MPFTQAVMPQFRDAYHSAFWDRFQPSEKEICFLSQYMEGDSLTVKSRQEESALYLAAQHEYGTVAALDYVELNLEEMAQEGVLEEKALDSLEEKVEDIRPQLESSMQELTAQTQSYMREHDSALHRHMAQRHPKAYELAVKHRQQLRQRRKK